jgi:hypothetical protein
MFAIIYLLGTFIADLLKSWGRLEVKNLLPNDCAEPASERAVLGRRVVPGREKSPFLICSCDTIAGCG